MAKDASAIKQEIAQTRERMGDTVEALAYKADVPARVKDSVQDRVDTVKDRIGDVVDNVKTALNGASDSVGDAVDSGTRNGTDVLSRTREKVSATVANATDAMTNVGNDLTDRLADADVAGNAQRAVGAVQENPIGLALGALAIGFVAGSMLPVSEAERARLKPIGDRIAVQAQAATNDLVAAGKAVAIETAQTAVATALSSAKSHGQDVVDAAKSRAES